MTSKHNIHLIVAVCDELGIGYKGNLPWLLRNEMKYFSSTTRRTKDQEKQNAVIMGRKTWFSIPEKNRPLISRVNIVLTRQQKEIPDAPYTSGSLEEAIKLISADKLKEKVETIWVIGGYEIYKATMESGLCDRIYLTRIMKKYECDVFFPEICNKKYRLATDPYVPTEVQEENEIKYKYEVYEKV